MAEFELEVIPTLSPDATVDEAISLMEDQELKVLPVVDEQGVLLAVVRNDDLLNWVDGSAKLPTQLMLAPQSVAVKTNDHYLEALQVAAQYQLDVVPVINGDGIYKGVIEVRQAFDQLFSAYFSQAAGAIIVLEMPERDYSLGYLGRLVEANDVKILQAFVEVVEDTPSFVKVTMKLNQLDASRVIATLERFGITVTERYQQSAMPDFDEDRLGSFLRFLNT